MTIMCSAVGCKSKMGAKKKGEKISFHRFPKEEKLKNKWVVNVGREEWKPTDFSRLCSLHFEPACYRDGLHRRILHSYAIPTIFSTHKATLKKNPRKPQLRLKQVTESLPSASVDENASPKKTQLRLKPVHELLTSVSEDENVNPKRPQLRVKPDHELFISGKEDENRNPKKSQLCLKPVAESSSSASEDETEVIIIKCPERQYPGDCTDTEEIDMLEKGLKHYKMLAEKRGRKLKNLQRQHLRVKKKLAYLEDILLTMTPTEKI